MTHGRIETTPEQQLAELRVAYARYTTLAEQLRDETDIDPRERSAREQYALRIAHAYEKSIASNTMRLESLRPPRAQAHRFGPVTMVGGALVIAAAVTAVLATARPDLIQTLKARVTAPAPLTVAAVKSPVAPIAMRAPIAVPAPAVMPAPHAKPVPKVTPAPVAAPARTPVPELFVPAHRPVQAGDQSPAKTRSAEPAPVKAQAPILEARAPAQLKAAAAPAAIASPSPAPPTAMSATRQAALEPLPPPRMVEALPLPPAETATPAAKAAETAAPGTKAADTITPAAKAADNIAPPKLVPVLRTHLLPPYPIEAKKAGEQGTTQMQVSISTTGVISDCRVLESSGSERLDGTACSFVQRVWRWLPPTRDGQPAPATTKISVIWNLTTAR